LNTLDKCNSRPLLKLLSYLSSHTVTCTALLTVFVIYTTNGIWEYSSFADFLPPTFGSIANTTAPGIRGHSISLTNLLGCRVWKRGIALFSGWGGGNKFFGINSVSVTPLNSDIY